MITIYTRSRSFLTKEFWKWVARRLLRKYSGPNAVEDSLLRGLKKLNVPFKRNTEPAQGDVALILSGVEALSEAIALKQIGRIKKIIAGPNIVAHPRDADGAMLSTDIDIILVPSQWVADLWIHEAPELAEKIRVWPAGVQLSAPSTRDGIPIIYDKLRSPELVAQIQDRISACHIFTYGTFKQQDYLSALADAPYLVYLAQSESQGLALQEAWAHNVPTFVNKSTRWESADTSWEAPQINAPYLTPELGAVFNSIDELTELFSHTTNLNPKEYCDVHLSDEASTRILLNLL